ncbi:MAG: FixH family protein [Pseudomonadota bacterium]
MSHAADSRELKGGHVLLWLLAFFGVMFAVNGVFLYQAIVSFPGEDIPKSYLQGLQYNDVLAARSAQADLGWRAEMGVEDGALLVRLNDTENAPISGRVVVGGIRHSATTAMDTPLVFRAAGGGLYAASLADLPSGHWESFASVIDPDTETVIFTAHKSVTLP